MEEMKCSNCKFYVKDKYECRRFPPSFQATSEYDPHFETMKVISYSNFVTSQPDDLCGEWRQAL